MVGSSVVGSSVVGSSVVTSAVVSSSKTDETMSSTVLLDSDAWEHPENVRSNPSVTATANVLNFLIYCHLIQLFYLIIVQFVLFVKSFLCK